MRIKRERMHIDRANEIAMAPEAAPAADPVSSPGLVFMSADRTPAPGSSFGAGEARDADPFGFVGEIVDVAAVFPLRHAAIVVTATIAGAHTVRISDEERSHSLPDAKVDDSPRGLMPEIAHAPLGPATDPILGSLELLPTA